MDRQGSPTGGYYYDSDKSPGRLASHIGDEDTRGSTANLFDSVLHAQGIDRYVDPRCLQREVADAHDLRSRSAMDRAARQLQTASGGGRAAKAGGRGGHNRYSDQSAGQVDQHELRDYNEFSPAKPPQQQPVPSPRGQASQRNNTPSTTASSNQAWQARKVPKPQAIQQEDLFDETVYVTTL